jgi:exonuclease VII small subunit
VKASSQVGDGAKETIKHSNVIASYFALQDRFSADSMLIGRSYMDTQQIISELEAERDRLEQAISALRGSMNGRRGIAAVGGGRRGRRHLSAAAKKRISDMMKKRWAERKRAAKAA